MENPRFDQLVVACRRNTTSMQALVSEYGDIVYTFLVYMTGRENADGLFPEIWLRVHDSAGRFIPEGNPRPFIFKITHETAQGYYIDAGGTSTELKPAVSALPTDQRLIFLLRQVGELPYKKISPLLNLPLETVLKRMNGAIDALAAALEKHRA